MSNFLIDESPQVYHPTLAAWIGLNEAIFLAQLHYVLTKNDTVGKFADGRKWYRDKPHDFVVKYFPFWDEGIVKRVIDNLRGDGLIMARSDLNKDPKDRSLWYTIYYEAIERLDGPVERLTQKAAKRKEARRVRTEKTKVQNVLMDKSTKCTEAKVQNVLSILPETKVQNVPIPKDSLPKDSKTKEPSPIGEGDKSPPVETKPSRPETIPAVQVFVEVSGRHVLNKAQMGIIDEKVGRSPPALERWRETVKAWLLRGYKINNADGMLDWFENGIPQKQGVSQNGHKRTEQSNQKNNTDQPAIDADTLRRFARKPT